MRPKVNSLFTALAVFDRAAEINISAVFYVFTALFVTAALRLRRHFCQSQPIRTPLFEKSV